MDVLSRPYPLAVSGHDLEYSFDVETKVFQMAFHANQDISLPSIIFVPQHIYGDELKVLVSNDLTYKMSKENNQVIEIEVNAIKELGRMDKSWVVIGIDEKINTLGTETTWSEIFQSLIDWFK